jgi:hypothetical protein
MYHKYKVLIARHPNIKIFSAILSGSIGLFMTAYCAVKPDTLLTPLRLTVIVIAFVLYVFTYLILLTEVPTLTFQSFSETMRELRYAIMLRPISNWSNWSFNGWLEQMNHLSTFIERQITGILKNIGGGSVACNLLIAIPEGSTEQEINQIGNYVNPNGGTQFPYTPMEEGIVVGTSQKCFLLMVCRGDASRLRFYPWICLRVPEEMDRALPGAPTLMHCMLAADKKSDYLMFEYISHPVDVNLTNFNPGVSDRGKDAFSAYFFKHKRHVKSFLSVGLSWNGNPIGILNIDSKKENFLSDEILYKAVTDALTPYAEIAGALAFVFRELYNSKWVKEVPK